MYDYKFYASTGSDYIASFPNKSKVRLLALMEKSVKCMTAFEKLGESFSVHFNQYFAPKNESQFNHYFAPKNES